MYRPNPLLVEEAIKAVQTYTPHRQSKWLWAWPIYSILREREATHCEAIDWIIDYFGLEKKTEFEPLANSMAGKLHREKNK